jgi:hypothetical protein
VSVLILEYIAVASAVNNFALEGILNSCSSDSRLFESFIYDGIRKSRSFILKSNQLLNIDRKLLMQLTTGRSVIGVL